jgi:hypothetical protein
MKLWELRSYEEVIRREQDRLVYRARLRARYGVAWRRKAPIEAIMPLRLAKYGVPLAETADAGLQAAGIEVLPPVRQLAAAPAAVEPAGEPEGAHGAGEGDEAEPAPAQEAGRQERPPLTQEELYARQYAQQQAYERQTYEHGYYPEWQGTPHDSPWFAAQQQYQQAQYEQYQQYQAQQAQAQAQQQQQQQQQQVMVPSGPEQMRPLGNGGAVNGFGGANGANGAAVRPVPGPRQESNGQTAQETEFVPQPEPQAGPAPQPEPVPESETYPASGLELPDGVPLDEAYFAAYRTYVRENGSMPTARQFARFLPSVYAGTPPEERELVTAMRELRYRYTSEANAESIP